MMVMGGRATPLGEDRENLQPGWLALANAHLSHICYNLGVGLVSEPCKHGKTVPVKTFSGDSQLLLGRVKQASKVSDSLLQILFPLGNPCLLSTFSSNVHRSLGKCEMETFPGSVQQFWSKTHPLADRDSFSWKRFGVGDGVLHNWLEEFVLVFPIKGWL